MVRYSSGFSLCQSGDLPYLVCEALGVPHAFSTRLGGVSHGAGLDSLDLGMGDAVSVGENRRRFLTVFGGDPEAYFTAKQIHSPRIETVGRGDLGRDFVCDGFVTAEKGVTLSIKIADCVPILLCDPATGVIAAVHAGWRGTVAGVAVKAIEAMAACGASPERTVAAIGPSIRSCCYEVDTPFLAAVSEAPYAAQTLPYIKRTSEDGRYRADLVGMNRALLQLCGVSDDRCYVSGFCTSCASRLFYSHRASCGQRGLLMAAIRQ